MGSITGPWWGQDKGPDERAGPGPWDDASPRHALVGTGGFATAYLRSLAFDHPEAGTVVAWCAPDPAGTESHEELLREAGYVPPVRYAAEEFAALLDEQRPEVVVVAAPAASRHRYIVPALLAGCDVVVEQPLAVAPGAAAEIATAAARARGRIVMAFAGRYSPRNARLRGLITDGELGVVTSVRFERRLRTGHGTGPDGTGPDGAATDGAAPVEAPGWGPGHLVGPDADLVSWWLDDVPAVVRAPAPVQPSGGGPPGAGGCGPADLAVRVDYARGAVLAYSLQVRAGWEGYRVAVEGSRGRAELDVVRRGAVSPVTERLLVQRPGEPARILPPPPEAEGRSDDARLLDDLLGRYQAPDPSGRRAGCRDGLRAAAMADAAQRSLATGTPVELAAWGLPLGGG